MNEQDLEAILADPTHPDYIKVVNELTDQYSQQYSQASGFRQDLDYTHERLYRAVSGVVVAYESFRERLDEAQQMLVVLRQPDFPRALQKEFQAVMKTHALAMTEEDAEGMTRKLVQLFLTLSEDVINYATLGNHYEQAAWCVMQAREGRPEALRHFIATTKKQKMPLPAIVKAFLAERVKGLVKVRRGMKSLHPARVIAIARLMRDRFEFQKHHDTTATLDQAAIYIGRLLHKSKKTINAAYYSVYAS